MAVEIDTLTQRNDFHFYFLPGNKTLLPKKVHQNAYLCSSSIKGITHFDMKQNINVNSKLFKILISELDCTLIYRVTTKELCP